MYKRQEYYDENLKTWIMVDPTWGNTTGGVDYFYTLDFDHFAFVIKGASSTYPVPAGGYKISKSQKTRDINVEFGDNFDPPSQTLSIGEDFSKSYFSGFNIQGNILIKNVGNVISEPQAVIIATNFLKPTKQKIYFGKIPPYGSLTIPISFKKPSLLTNKNDTVKITINDNYISKNVLITPFILNKWTIGGGILFAGIAITLSIIAYKARNLSFFRRKE